ncbi:hypothetical protein [Shewanella sp.]|uniref:hypothetical protein n=1 Tax=Shewanella sp. TaxID=50422 RepID=UPI0040545354
MPLYRHNILSLALFSALSGLAFNANAHDAPPPAPSSAHQSQSGSDPGPDRSLLIKGNFS